jgi:serine/threonine protein kinase
MEHDERNYQILSTIATGGTAVLYKAIQTSLDRFVVVKRLHSHLISDPNFTKRFKLEAKAAASLDHENIVRIIDFGSSHDNYYIVMEYIDGSSLKDILGTHGKLDQELSLLIAREVCLGLDHAHQRGIIHRDIKPANIMVTIDGQVKITDFGLAKLHRSQTQQTVANTLLGTPLYMSPEQAIGENVDGRSDLFSLGTMCYEMLTGTQPFQGDNYAVVIQNILHGNIPQPSKFCKHIDSDVESLVMKALSREPVKRPRTALEMARMIESILGQDRILSARMKLRRLAQGKDARSRDDTLTSASKRTRTARYVPRAVAAVMAIAAALILLLNPGVIDTMRTRITALYTPDPVAPVPGNWKADNFDMFGSVRFEPIPLSGYGDSTTVAGEAPSAADTLERTLDQPVPSESAAPEEAAPERMTSDPMESKPETSGPAAPQPTTSVPSTPADTAGTTPAAATEQQAEVPPAVGYLDITVDSEAAISIDGERRTYGTRLGPLELSAGSHEILCEREGYREYRERLSIKKSEMSKRNVFLQKMTGGVHFETVAGAMIYINGTYQGLTPTGKPIVLPSGTCRIELKRAGFKPWTSDVYIPPDEVVWLKIELSPL